MPKNKKKSFEKKNQPTEQGREMPAKNTASSDVKTENIEGNAVMTFIFGHPKIDRKDMTEIIIAVVLVALLVFMQLKQNDII